MVPLTPEVKRHARLEHHRRQADAISRTVEHVPKKLLDFFDQDMLQVFDFERFLVDHVIPRDRETL